MTIKTLNAAETWEAVYDAYTAINFTAYDYDTVKASLIEYLRTYYPENFNDFIESSELVQIISSFAYVVELLAYRTDLLGNENSITSAQRKQSILKLARFVSYAATRNLPARGLVKVTSISTTESVTDSQGNALTGRTITWADPNNSRWKEQFFLVMNAAMTRQFGQPSKAFQVDDISFSLYELNGTTYSFTNSVIPYNVSLADRNMPMELVCADLDENGPYERYVDGANKMQLLYAQDGLGDTSDYTGFMFYTKQGALKKNSYTFSGLLPNRTTDIDVDNVNNTDVWVNKVDQLGNLITKWEHVDNVFARNLFFNTIKTKNKFEIETLEDDKIRVIFGDGEFAAIPVGNFDIWVRQSDNSDTIIEKSRVSNEATSFAYTSARGLVETCTLTFSLVSDLTNGSAAEEVEHIRRNAPQTFYSQNRMVNGQDYNTLPLRESSILKVSAINRTFIGQPSHIDWNDASNTYQNVKVFGDDGFIYYDFGVTSFTSAKSSRVLVDDVISPILTQSGVRNMINYLNIVSDNADLRAIRSVPRTVFLEDDAIALEKTAIQGMLDSHWYGEPQSFTVINGTTYAVVNNDADQKIYDPNMPRATYDSATATYDIIDGGLPSYLQAVAAQPSFGMRYVRTVPIIGDGTIGSISSTLVDTVVTVECIATQDGISTFTVTPNVGTDVSWPTAISGAAYSHNGFEFTITQGADEFHVGDAFIVRADLTSTTANLLGRWEVIPGAYLDRESFFDASTAGSVTPGGDASWLVIVDRLTDSSFNVIGYAITHRDLQIIARSTTTRFWFNENLIIDGVTKKPVRDKFQLLKSNLRASDATAALGVNQVYDVIGAVTSPTGVVDVNAIQVYPHSNIDNTYLDANRFSSLQFADFVKLRWDDDETPDFVYFKINGEQLIPITPGDVDDTVIDGFTGKSFISDDSLYARRVGRGGLDFLWQHFSAFTNIIDPSPTNINDMIVITKGYYDSVKSFLTGKRATMPTPPSSLELRNSYRELLENKMISDTVVMRSGRFKLLFGANAIPQLRAKFKIIRSPGSTLSADQIRLNVVSIVNDYFDINNWDFAQTFYATDLIASIHGELVTDISSCVLVPTFATNYFGSLLVIEAGDDEILQASVTVDDIEIVEAYTPSVLRQRR